SAPHNARATIAAALPAMAVKNSRRPDFEFMDVVCMNPIVVQVGQDEILPHFPSKRGGAFSLRLKRPSDPHSIGMNWVYFDPSTARVLRVDRFDQQRLGVRIIRLLTPLHYGTIGGYPTRALWIAAGLMPGVLFSSRRFL